MNNLLARNWWAMMVRGVAALAFGLITLVVPGITLGALLMVFGAFVIVDGVFSLVAGIRASGHREHWGSLVVSGLAGLAAGLIALFAPVAAAVGFALLIGGAVVTESVFAVPGLGRLTVDAILRRDLPVIQGVVLMFSLTYVLVNMTIDILYTFIDPRIRY